MLCAHYSFESPSQLLRNLLLIIFLFSAWNVSATEDIFEPFSTSNLNPFSQIYGPPLSRSAKLVETGKFDWHLQYEVANNFTDGTTGVESVVIDGETHRTTLSIGYGISDRWDVRADVPYLNHRGGSLDGFIENWHDFWGLPNGGREKVEDDLLRYIHQSGSLQTRITRSSSAIGDVRLSLGYRLSENDESTRIWTIRGGVKLPTGEPEDLTGSDSSDVFFTLHLSDTEVFSHPALNFHGSLGFMSMGDGDILEDHLEDYLFYGSSTIAWSVSKRVSLKAQFDFHSAVYDSDLKELGDFTGQLIVGGSIRLSEASRLDISVSEDIITDTSPDVVLQLGLHLAL